ncbi:unnamed protein product [Scytosiphon promiscuus]
MSHKVVSRRRCSRVSVLDFFRPARIFTSTNEQNGTSGDDLFFAVAVGEDGSSVLAGESEMDFAVVKLDADGNTLWHFQDGTDGEDVASGVVISPEDGSVVVVGSTQGDWDGTSSGEEDFAAFKLDSNGTLIWKWQDGTNYSDSMGAVAMVDNGVAICGTTDGSFGGPSAGSSDFVAIKLDDTRGGAEVWRWQAGSSENDGATTIAAVGSADVVIAGYTQGHFSGDNAGGETADAVAVKLNGTDGNEIWRWQGGSDDADLVGGAAVQADGGIVLGGTTYGRWDPLSDEEAGASVSYMAVYLTEDGQEFTNFQNGSGSEGNELVFGVAAGLDGTVILAGFVDGTYAPEDVGTADMPYFTDFLVVSLDTSIIADNAPAGAPVEEDSADVLNVTPIIAWAASAVVAAFAGVAL